MNGRVVVKLTVKRARRTVGAAHRVVNDVRYHVRATGAHHGDAAVHWSLNESPIGDRTKIVGQLKVDANTTVKPDDRRTIEGATKVTEDTTKTKEGAMKLKGYAMTTTDGAMKAMADAMKMREGTTMALGSTMTVVNTMLGECCIVLTGK